ncbi:MAG: M28 family peptidase [bacterium]
MRPLVALAGALLVLLAISGCSQPPTTPPPAPPSAPATLLERVAEHAGNVTVDGKAAADWWAAWVQAHPERLPATPRNAEARDAIVAELRAAGLYVEIHRYPVGTGPLRAPPQVPLTVSAVVAYHNGTGQPDHVIALTSHYDTMAGTLYGAYDNGSGTAADLAVCKALAARPMNKTLACIFFDGEEEGTLASREFAKEVAGASGQVHYDVVLGFDMTGINWPGYPAWKLYAWVGDEFAQPIFPFVNGTLHKVLGYPDAGAQAFPFNDRNSDEASFKAIHVPTVRFAGGRTASTYPQYHMPQDTVDFVDQFVGGRANFEAGLGAIIRTAVQLGLEFDQVSLADLTAEYA